MKATMIRYRHDGGPSESFIEITERDGYHLEIYTDDATDYARLKAFLLGEIAEIGWIPRQNIIEKRTVEIP